MAILMIFLSNILISGLHDDGFLPLSYTGLWSVIEDENAHGGGYRVSSDGLLTFVVDSPGFAVYGVRSMTGGNGTVCIDEDCITRTWNAPVTVYSEIFAISDLGAGSHTVTISAVGEIAIDAIYIYPPAQQTPEPEATPEPEPAYISTYEDGSIYENRIDAGQKAIIELNLFIAGVVLFGVGYMVIWGRND